ncbi:MAG: aminopeptidase P N-terminal domain-containing protein [Leptospiraceae bacterium]|nr:aminopeptidase P N-terminal domain-containing protein [Leptospiraceae bacterium]MCP5502793.1 aminopeptidase P N-terminal domain-containing protein [Leptospiraceae bacterium]
MQKQVFLNRIRQVQAKLQEGELLLLYGAGEKIRNRDVEYKFRQESNFYYLSGHDEPDAIFVLKRDYSAMFVLPRDKSQEIWTGTRVGKKKIKKDLELSEAFELKDWKKKRESLLTNVHTLYYFFGESQERDLEVLETCKVLNRRLRDGKIAPERLVSPYFLHEMRLRKSEDELQCIREAVRVTAEGHIQLFKYSKEGMYEYELEAMLENSYKRNGAWGGGYGHIVASGANATILHYTKNNAKLKKGQLVLVDSGAEKNYYTADVTRVFPVDKAFSTAQRELYSLVLEAQKKAIQLCKEGTKFLEVHEETKKNLIRGMKDLKLLKGSMDEIIEKKSYERYYMHKTGHWLGMDVHDVGKYYIDGESRAFENGMITTIEPGIYVDIQDKKAPKEFRGIGIRIEDNILINADTPTNLTESIPKEISEIEDLRS